MKKFFRIMLLLTIAITLYIPMQAQEKSDIYVRPTQNSKLKKAAKIALALVGTGIGIGVVILSTRCLLYRCCRRPQRPSAFANPASW